MHKCIEKTAQGEKQPSNKKTQTARLSENRSNLMKLDGKSQMVVQVRVRSRVVSFRIAHHSGTHGQLTVVFKVTRGMAELHDGTREIINNPVCAESSKQT